MARNPGCTVYIGNLDEKVTDRILYEILIQVGRVVDLYMPLDKETNRHKGYAFAEYESEDIADYAVRLFSGLVRLYNKTLKFAMSGQDKPSQKTGTPVTPKTNVTPATPHSVHGREVERLQGATQLTDCRVSAYYTHPGTPLTPVPRFQGSGQVTDCRVSAYTHPVTPLTPVPNSPHLPRPYPPHAREMATFPDSPGSVNCRVSAYTHSLSPGYPQASARGFLNSGVTSSNFDYSGRVFGSMSTAVNCSDSRQPDLYPPYSRYH